jgi:hypothetical protein
MVAVVRTLLFPLSSEGPAWASDATVRLIAAAENTAAADFHLA